MYYYSPYRQDYRPPDPGVCPFCDSNILQLQVIRRKDQTAVENESYVWLVNYYPKFEGHTLLIPKQHRARLEDESPREAADRHRLLQIAAVALPKVYPGCGVEVFLQCGPGSGATVPHLHWHVVPAHPSDPLRAFEKLGHFYAAHLGEVHSLSFPVGINLARDQLQRALTKVLDW